MKQGAKVEARFGGGNDWFTGIIARINGPDSFNITYDDGTRPMRERVRWSPPRATNVPGACAA